MTDILSQEEIDKLLKTGLGGSEAEEEKPQSFDHSQSETSSQSAGSHPFSGGGQDLPSFDSVLGLKKSATVKRSSVLEDEKKTNVQIATFPSFDMGEAPPESTELGIILDIKLEIRVELGSTKSTIRKVLDMGTGSVIELDKQNGEPIDLVVNKKAFAKGEMIVIGENFGARITDILSVHEIIEALR